MISFASLLWDYNFLYVIEKELFNLHPTYSVIIHLLMETLFSIHFEMFTFAYPAPVNLN